MNTNEKNNAKSICTYIRNNKSPLHDLYKKAHDIQEMDHKLKKLLDPILQDHFELANLNADIAVLLVSSSAWATRLRYNIPTILNALNKVLNLNSVKTIRIKVKHSILDKPGINKKPIYLSNNAARFLNDTAKNFSDPELRACLIKLSKNHQ